MAKHTEKPANLRYKAEGRKIKNKIARLLSYMRKHPNDQQTAARLAELQAAKK